MPDPVSYKIGYSFSGFQANSPQTPLPAARIDTELASISTAITSVIAAIKSVRRSDGRLNNASVGVDQLSPELSIGFSLPSAWAQNTDYTADSTVFHNNQFLHSNGAHNSGGAFDPTKWTVIADFGEQADMATARAAIATAQAEAATGQAEAAAVSATGAAGSASDAGASETAAANSAAASASSAAAAAGSATGAGNSATAAGTSATNAANSATAAAASAAATTNALASANVWPFSQTFTASNGQPGYHVKAAAANYGFVQWDRANSVRWKFGMDNGAESGGNAGSDFRLDRYADDGATYLGTPLTISRATGAVTLAGPVALGANSTAVTQAATDSSTKVATTNYVKSQPAFTGDSGAGGVKGLVPAPAAGDAAAGKFLKADGTYAVPAGAGGGANPATVAARLTLTSGVPVTVADVTGATVLYLSPHKGNTLGLYDGAAWQVVTFAEKSLKVTDTQNGTTSSTSAVISGLTDTSQFVVGMEVSGTGVPASRTVASIDSGTQITMNGNGNANGTAAITFKLPAGANYDVYAKLVSGAPKLFLSPVWTNDVTRAVGVAYQDGIMVKSGDPTLRVLGSVGVPALSGTLEDSYARRLVSNLYNDEVRLMKVTDPTDTWTYSTAAFRQANGNTANQLEFLMTVARQASAFAMSMATNSTTTGRTVGNGIGLDSSVSNAATLRLPGSASGAAGAPMSWYMGDPGVGRHTLRWLEMGGLEGSDTQTWRGDLGTAPYTQVIQSGITGSLRN